MAGTSKTVGVVDVPLKAGEPDALGLLPYATALANFILACDTPMTVGIQGDWGAGKTSLMNLIAGELANHKSRPLPPTLTLNTWQYAQVASGEGLALVVLRALHERVSGDGIAKVWGRMARAFGRVKGVQFAGIGVETHDEVEPLPDLADLKSSFEKSVQDRLAEAGPNHDRLVIFVDDLDRILPERAVEILEALKNFVDVPGCIFVLACDYGVVTKGLTKKFGIGEKELGRSFFDKIIQVPFRMPVYRYDVDKYLRDMLGHIRWKIWKGDVSIYRRLIESSVGFNPRGLKRLCNTLLLLRMVAEGSKETAALVADEQRLVLLFALICMESAHEQLYKKLAQSTDKEVIELLESVAPNAEEETGRTQAENDFLAQLASVIDIDANTKISEDEVDRLLSMVRLSAVTARVGEAERREEKFPSAEELISQGIDAMQQARFSPLLALIRPLAGSVLRERTTTGNIAWDVQRDGKWTAAFGVTPFWRTMGATVFFFFDRAIAEASPDAAKWAACRAELERLGASRASEGGSYMRMRVDSAELANDIVRALSSVWPFDATPSQRRGE